MTDMQHPESLSLSSVVNNAEGASMIKNIYYYLLVYSLFGIGVIALVSYLNGGFRHFFLVIFFLYLLDKADKFKNGKFYKLYWLRNIIKFLVGFPFLLVAFFMLVVPVELGLLAFLIFAYSPLFALSIWGYFIVKWSKDNEQLDAEIQARSAPWIEYRKWLEG